MGSFEERLQRLKSVDISKDCKTEAGDSAPPARRPASGGPKRELSDKAASLIATALKDFLRD